MLPQRTYSPRQSSKHDSDIHLDDDDSTVMPTDSDVSIDRTSPPKLRSAKQSSTHTSTPLSHPTSVTCIRGARLPRKPLLWDIHLRAGRIRGIEPHDFNSASQTHIPGVMEAEGCLVAPSLCHAHIHLDKCFLLQDPRFSDLQIVKGDFKEAMELTNRAKSRFTPTDLLRRGRQLIEESIKAGVTSMRAFVEMDAEVGFKCLDTGIQLKNEYKESGRMDIQLCAFAQAPLFSGQDSGSKTRDLMAQAAERWQVDVLGSTPYVESNLIQSKMNVRWIAGQALRRRKFLDLHLDYYIEPSRRPLIWNVIDILQDLHWNNRSGRSVTLGHCTRLTLFKTADLSRLSRLIESSKLPISFVGLPTSDLFMMRISSTPNFQPQRGTLAIPDMIRKHGLQASIAVNNVCNAFTPQGSADPLSVASTCVGLYSAGTNSDTNLLYECVSSRARQAIGLTHGTTLDLKLGEAANLVVFDKDQNAPWRTRKNISQLVYDPAGVGRTTILNGRVTNLATTAKAASSTMRTATSCRRKQQPGAPEMKPPRPPPKTKSLSQASISKATLSGPESVFGETSYALSVDYSGQKLVYHYHSTHNNSKAAYALTVDYDGSPRTYHFHGGNSITDKSDTPSPYALSVSYGKGAEKIYRFHEAGNSSSKSTYSLVVDYDGFVRKYHF